MAATIYDALNEEFKAWAEDFLRIRARRAKNQLGEATGKGQKSFDLVFIKASRSALARAYFMFESYLRYYDLRRINKKNQRPVKRFEEWIKQRGVGSFIQRFSQKHKLPPDINKVINRMAWGIVKKRQKKRRKRRRWYTKSQSQAFGILYANLLNAMGQFSADELAKLLKDAKLN